MKETLHSAKDSAPSTYLPTDILVNVLSRFPVKVLYQFRCVSKEWLKLISSDKHFIDSHRKTSLENPVLLFAYHYAVNRSNKEYAVQLSSVDMNGRFDSCFRKPDDSSYSFFNLSCAGLGCLSLVDNSSEDLIKDVWMFMHPRNKIWVKKYSTASSALNNSETVFLSYGLRMTEMENYCSRIVQETTDVKEGYSSITNKRKPSEKT
ncbi:hypothetical protein RJ639_047038 [Escallonia herrerae]|uniref:F-box domain-containing protein n=1 Tax=Escallonia herrerae TaxID=1293975 RepID=A0AA89B115_9ASTE|nr:hypothetical protein RJ639_047038 [Escallonia herrerae]